LKVYSGDRLKTNCASLSDNDAAGEVWDVSTHVKVADVGRPLHYAQPVLVMLQQAFERCEGHRDELHRHKGYERSGVGRQQHCCRHV